MSSQFDDLDNQGFLSEAVYVTVGPKAMGDGRFSVFCEDCATTVAEGLTQDAAAPAANLHRKICPKMGRTLRYVT